MSNDTRLNIDMGERLQEIRLEVGLKQSEVYNTDSGQRKVSNIEGGKAKADPEYLLFWVRKGYNANWILTGEGSKKIDYSDELINLLRFKADVLKSVKG